MNWWRLNKDVGALRYLSLGHLCLGLRLYATQLLYCLRLLGGPIGWGSELYLLTSWWLLNKILDFRGVCRPWLFLLPNWAGEGVFFRNFLVLNARLRRRLLLGDIDLSAQVAFLVVGRLRWLLILILSSRALARRLSLWRCWRGIKLRDVLLLITVLLHLLMLLYTLILRGRSSFWCCCRLGSRNLRNWLSELLMELLHLTRLLRLAAHKCDHRFGVSGGSWSRLVPLVLLRYHTWEDLSCTAAYSALQDLCGGLHHRFLGGNLGLLELLLLL